MTKRESPSAEPKVVDKESPTGEEEGFDDTPMTIWEHLDELRKRVIYSVVTFIAACFGAWELRERILALFYQPFADSWIAQGVPGKPELNYDTPSALFMAYVKIAMIGGAAMAAPVIFYQLWRFIAPGLYSREKRYVIPFVLLSTILFVGGGYFAWRAAFPITFDYFLGLSQTSSSGGTEAAKMLTITPRIMIGPYLDFVSQMLLAFGIIFEIPLLALFLSVAGIVNYLHMIRFGRWFILVAFVVAAIITPPDATSQLIMAVPMCILYGLSIGLAYVFGKPPSEAQREAFRNRKKKPEQQPG